MIRISNLNKYFYKNKPNEIHVINDTTLEFPDTGLVTILGESGSGKTTLMNVIGGLDDFYSGCIEIDDFKINKYSSKKMDRIRNEKIGYIFQNYLLLQGRTVYENLEILLNMYDLSFEEKNERIDYVLHAVGMMKYKKKSISELSGGQQQRVAIARALIKSPSLILADEPTGNLDEKNTIQIMNIIKKISKTTLVILVSHEQSIARTYSDYIIEVNDGKVVSFGDIKEKAVYQFEDDQNLYLKEYKYSKIENDNVNIDFYSNDNQKINLQIIFEKGKFYIKSSNEVIYLNDESEVKILDENKKVLNAETEIDENDYELDALEFVKTPSLPFKEIINLSLTNLKKMKKRTRILSFPLILLIILVLVCVQSVKSAAFVDKQSLVFSDSHIYHVNLEKGDSIVTTPMAVFGAEKILSDIMENVPEVSVELAAKTDFIFYLPSFSQVSSKRFTLKGFSLLSNEKVKEEDLILGKLPELATDVIVEKWVLENALKDSTLANFMTVESFLNKTITLKERNYSFKIVGIVDNNENSVYMNKWALLDLAPSDLKKNGIKVISVSEFEKFNGEKISIDIDKTQCLLNVATMSYYGYRMLTLNGDSRLDYEVMGTIDFKDCPYDVIVTDECYEAIFKSVASTNHEVLKVYCDNEEEKNKLNDYLESIKAYYLSGDLKATEENGYTKPTDYTDVKLSISLDSEYHKIIDPYIEESNKTVLSRMLITITILAISVVIVFFSMKSYAIKNIYDIGVYRAIGINKKSVALLYAFQVLMISLKTTLVGGFVCFALTQIIAGVPLIEAEAFSISLDMFLICTGGMILLNVIVGTMPVIMYMRLTPSKLLTKYDI